MTRIEEAAIDQETRTAFTENDHRYDHGSWLSVRALKVLRMHASYDGPNGVWTVHTPLRVFKKTFGYEPDQGTHYNKNEVLTELELPVGALIVAESLYSWMRNARIGWSSQSRKMRANEAVVVSHRKIGTGEMLASSNSLLDVSFEYRVGQTVRPTMDFYMGCEQCAAGIHFFIDQADAESYML
ncbi:hypothetical protein FDI24_gp060 [Acidovorax phage ACP17]|uniref:Uncharacterized protein n=1 Tax=Acidovorax phage ACP17 TaxID=2010329 RepID=A0A218M3G5_9CAUD|nr:hypothetical protein FDI24_gp060 [Acidovorax phage ACP17]ASD50585.1 hypothetical protein [Acidovorax phage ACP17]